MKVVQNPTISDQLMPPDLGKTSGSELLTYFKHAWDLNELLFSAIKEETTYYINPDPLRHPLIFYYGHTAAFYINKLVMAGVLESGINPYFEEIFAKGVDPDLPQNLDTLEVWPKLNEVRSYRQVVYNLVTEVINNTPLDLPINENHPLWSLMMGLEHDYIHFETSSVLIRQLEASLLEKAG